MVRRAGHWVLVRLGPGPGALRLRGDPDVTVVTRDPMAAVRRKAGGAKAVVVVLPAGRAAESLGGAWLRTGRLFMDSTLDAEDRETVMGLADLPLPGGAWGAGEGQAPCREVAEAAQAPGGEVPRSGLTP
jgi:hypothetical protein